MTLIEKASITFILLYLLLHSVVWAQEIKMGNIQYAGSGCQAGEVGFALSPDGSALSMIFDRFKVDVGQGALSGQKECRAMIPFEIPEGYSLRVFQVDYRGFNSLPQKVRAEFDTEYFFDSQKRRETRKTMVFKGPLISEFFEGNRIHARSPCGARPILNVGMNLKISSGDGKDLGFSQLDTLDVTSPRPARKKDRVHRFYLNLQKCEDAPRGGAHNPRT